MAHEVWSAGEPTDVPEEDWVRLAGTFLGVGFRLRVPAAAQAVADAAARAARVASVVGGTFDPVPWRALGGEQPVEVTGGWQRSLAGGLGPCWTRVAGASPSPDAGAAGRVLPWPAHTGSPTWGLPMLSSLAEREAGRWLALTGAGLGLWLDDEGRLVSTTRGAPLLWSPGGWLVPHGAVGGWVVEGLRARLGAAGADVAPTDLAACALFAVSDLREVTRVDSVDGSRLPAPEGVLAELAHARDTLLA